MWLEPKSEAEREALRKKGWQSHRMNVCWRCGGGGHNKKSLRRVGKTKEGQTVYGCAEHCGLIGQTV